MDDPLQKTTKGLLLIKVLRSELRRTSEDYGYFIVSRDLNIEINTSSHKKGKQN